MNYLAGVDASRFDLRSYLLGVDPAHVHLMIQDSACRRAMTKYDPLMFAIIYMSKSISDDKGVISFADMHFDLCRYALGWAQSEIEPMAHRDAFLAPRDWGKSTWLFKILPLWAAAHGHRKFVAAFTATGPQASKWLTNFKREIDGNALLRDDYPDLCTPAVRSKTGRAFNDTQHAYSSESGFTIVASGIDATTLGLNIDDARPDLIIFDDIEPDEANYSAYQKGQRLISVIDTCMGMNLKAVVAFVGTVVMIGSIFHDFVLHNDGETTDENRWVAEQRIRVHHYEPVAVENIHAGNGSSAVVQQERSTWPGKWSIEFIDSIKTLATYAKNWLNRPSGKEGEYWSPDLFVYGSLDRPAIKILSIDPAVKDKKTSDYTGLAVIAYDPLAEIGNPIGGAGAFEVIDAVQLRLVPGQPLVNRVNAFLATHSDIFAVLIEDNQGGMLWQSLFADLPVRLWTVTQTEPKWVRAQGALNEYQLGKVLHRRELRLLQRQMMAFPRVVNDDLVDAVTSGIRELRRRYALPVTSGAQGRVRQLG